MFDHVTIRVSDAAASRQFYVAALGPPTHDGDYDEWGDFSISPEGPTTRRLHIGFGAESRDAVDAWWKRMTAAGHTSDGEPGLRAEYKADYYGAFVLDPDGNSVEAVHHDTSRLGIDHLWLRTSDVAAVKAFYETIGPTVGVRLKHEEPDLVRFTDGDGTFTFVRGGEPTEHVHLAFGVPDTAAVDRFHGAATVAGYRDNGGPGERPQYHPGYYGAFVFDPDGHNVEAVYHGRR
jgi:catechol 2,3-dioxygenase-like lactoylglutathione lyase family enzyme